MAAAATTATAERGRLAHARESSTARPPLSAEMPKWKKVTVIVRPDQASTSSSTRFVSMSVKSEKTVQHAKRNATQAVPLREGASVPAGARAPIKDGCRRRGDDDCRGLPPLPRLLCSWAGRAESSRSRRSSDGRSLGQLTRRVGKAAVVITQKNAAKMRSSFAMARFATRQRDWPRVRFLRLYVSFLFFSPLTQAHSVRTPHDPPLNSIGYPYLAKRYSLNQKVKPSFHT